MLQDEIQIQIVHAKKITKGESLDNSVEEVQSVAQNQVESDLTTVSLPYPIRVEEIESSEGDDAADEVAFSFSQLLADEAGSDRAHDENAETELKERLGIPRPLNGPILLVNDKYVLINSMKKRMLLQKIRRQHGWICRRLTR